MRDIQTVALCKSYGAHTVLRDVNLTFPAGKTSAVMAPSGAGKTTLLRLLMGLEAPDSGEIIGMEGLRCGAVFQEDRLVDRMTAAGNLRLVRPALRREQILEALDAFGLSGCADQRAAELSGGMKRRVALLRALLHENDILLLDEPFKGLDEDTRERVMDKTREMLGGRTVILVTHDSAEAARLHANELYLPFGEKTDDERI